MISEYCDPFGKVSKRLGWLYRRLGLKYLIPFLLLLFYTVAGGILFRHLELAADTHKRLMYRNATVYALGQLTGRLLEIQCHDPFLFNQTDLQLNYTVQALDWFLDYINLTEVINDRTERTPWTWFGSMFYAGTLYTTIGYGRPATKTAAGQIATCIYIMIGIPIFLIILKEVGKYLSRFLRKMYKNWKQARKHIPAAPTPLRRASAAVSTKFSIMPHQQHTARQSQKQSVVPTDMQQVNSGNLGVVQVTKSAELNKEEGKRRGESGFPVSLALAILFIWILMSAALFCIWETEWGYFTSIYFFFVSISTVGLGDTIPSNPDMMLANFLLIIIGLSLLSMCVNLIQTWIEHLLDDMLTEFIEEFEKIAAVAAIEDVSEEAKPFELGVTGTLASGPLVAMNRETSGLTNVVKNWFAGRLAVSLARSAHLSSSAPTSDDDQQDESEDDKWSVCDDRDMMECGEAVEQRHGLLKKARVRKVSNVPALRAIQIISAGSSHKRGFGDRLLSNLISSDRVHLLETAIQKRVGNRAVGVQTDNDFTELLHFLAIPRNTVEEADYGSDTVRERSPSTATLKTLQSYHTAMEHLAMTDSGFQQQQQDDISDSDGHLTMSTARTSITSATDRKWIVKCCPKCGHKFINNHYSPPKRKTSALSNTESVKKVSFTLPPSAVQEQQQLLTEIRMAVDEMNKVNRDRDSVCSVAESSDENSYNQAVNFTRLDSRFLTCSSPVEDGDYFEPPYKQSSNCLPESEMPTLGHFPQMTTVSSYLDVVSMEEEELLLIGHSDIGPEWPDRQPIETRSSPDRGIRFLDTPIDRRKINKSLLNQSVDNVRNEMGRRASCDDRLLYPYYDMNEMDKLQKSFSADCLLRIEA